MPLVPTMSKPKKKNNYGTAKVEVEILSQAKYVALSMGKTLAEYLSDELRSNVGRAFEKFRKNIGQDNENK